MDQWTWLCIQQQYIFDCMTALKDVTERITRGEPIVLACVVCGEPLGVFRVFDGKERCPICEQIPSSPTVRAA